MFNAVNTLDIIKEKKKPVMDIVSAKSCIITNLHVKEYSLTSEIFEVKILTVILDLIGPGRTVCT